MTFVSNAYRYNVLPSSPRARCMSCLFPECAHQCESKWARLLLTGIDAGNIPVCRLRHPKYDLRVISVPYTRSRVMRRDSSPGAKSPEPTPAWRRAKTDARIRTKSRGSCSFSVSDFSGSHSRYLLPAQTRGIFSAGGESAPKNYTNLEKTCIFTHPKWHAQTVRDAAGPSGAQ